MIRQVDWITTFAARYNAPLKTHRISLNKAKFEGVIVFWSTKDEREAYLEEIINEFRNKFLYN